MQVESLYEKFLSALAGQVGDVVRRAPRPSTTVVLWQHDARGGVRIFWVKRSMTLGVLGGWHAFPGGGVAKSDATIAVAGLPRDIESASAPGPGRLGSGPVPPPLLVPGVLACAIRELFEETGILLAEELLGEAVPAIDSLNLARRRLLARELKFDEWLAAESLTLTAAPLVYAGRWITPPVAPFRFDTRFFLLHWPADLPIQPTVIPGELDSGAWIEPAEALAQWQQRLVLAAPPTLYVLQTLAERGPSEGLAELREPDRADAGRFHRYFQIRPGVIQLPLATPTLPPANHTNAFLLGAREVVLVDPGTSFPSEVERLKEALELMQQRFGIRVVAIWLTHHHPDHVAAAPVMAEFLGVPIAAHPLSAERLVRQQIHVDRELADDERVTLAGEPDCRVRIIHTPGHAPGHLAFLEESAGSLLVGDLVAGVGTIVIDPAEGSMDDYLCSLRRVRELGPSTLFPGHGPVIPDAAGKLTEYIEHRLWREGKVLDCWNAGVHGAAEMVPVVYADVPDAFHPLAERQLLAHLDRLEALGKIER